VGSTFVQDNGRKLLEKSILEIKLGRIYLLMLKGQTKMKKICEGLYSATCTKTLASLGRISSATRGRPLPPNVSLGGYRKSIDMKPDSPYGGG